MKREFVLSWENPFPTRLFPRSETMGIRGGNLLLDILPDNRQEMVSLRGNNSVFKKRRRTSTSLLPFIPLCFFTRFLIERAQFVQVALLPSNYGGVVGEMRKVIRNASACSNACKLLGRNCDSSRLSTTIAARPILRTSVNCFTKIFVRIYEDILSFTGSRYAFLK